MQVPPLTTQAPLPLQEQMRQKHSDGSWGHSRHRSRSSFSQAQVQTLKPHSKPSPQATQPLPGLAVLRALLQVHQSGPCPGKLF